MTRGPSGDGQSVSRAVSKKK
uniref:Uncharacterized protein n=1 Tax=Anguilla anguilla TaxID=7936 RepID=A0A0E9XWF4_ANGAN